MRISFHYSAASNYQGGSPVRRQIQSFNTPTKTDPIDGSYQTTESPAHRRLHPHHIHTLQPSQSPLLNRPSSHRKDRTLSPPSAVANRDTSTQLFEMGCKNLQCEMEELKRVLCQLSEEGELLQVERDLNKHQYQRLLQALDQECFVRRQKAKGLLADMVQLQISLSDAQQ